MTFLSYPTALLLGLIALLAVIFSYLSAPRQVRGVLVVAGALTVIAIVIDLVVALR